MDGFSGRPYMKRNQILVCKPWKNLQGLIHDFSQKSGLIGIALINAF
jgi:hypothetical protein